MKLDSITSIILYVFDTITFASSGERDVDQRPLGPAANQHVSPLAAGAGASPTFHGDRLEGDSVNTHPVIYEDTPPSFGTPKNPQDGTKRINCTYDSMPAYENCHGPNNRTCWLRKKDGSKYFDISSDYEKLSGTPNGTVRQFYLEVSEMPLSPDGVTMEHGKVFNRTYPGPWIEACWGDWLEITVRNKLRFNGTSIHWHGIRQLGTSHEDGVNGITQCPIAPGDTYTYKFRAMQYGSSWYHSHYSLQYGDGLLGPMTIYGPQTAQYDDDEAFRPILMTDWNHRSVFEDWPLMLESGTAPEMTNILLNGTGQYGPAGPKRPAKYQMKFDKGKKHMLILINTSVDTTFVFSIDEHELEVIEADFVPIHPYKTNKILVGIGQRYHVVVRGSPVRKAPGDNYWMRTIPALKCSKFACGPDDQMGIIRYDSKSTDNPLSNPFVFSMECSDEPYEKLRPFKNWTVKNPANINPTQTQDPPSHKAFKFDVGLTLSSGYPYVPDKALNRWDMHVSPLRINFSEPTLLNLQHVEGSLINRPHLDLVTLDNVTEDQWIWLLITSPDDIPFDGRRLFVPAAHPMHLHGHDFALLKQSHTNWNDDKDKVKFNCEDDSIQCNNPPRRDVALLPAGGYLIIAFKADNPGAWIIHCHIAFHASSGLAMQIVENKHLIERLQDDRKDEMKRVCQRWDKWLANPLNQWDWENTTHFQDDSGV